MARRTVCHPRMNVCHRSHQGHCFSERLWGHIACFSVESSKVLEYGQVAAAMGVNNVRARVATRVTGHKTTHSQEFHHRGSWQNYVRSNSRRFAIAIVKEEEPQTVSRNQEVEGGGRRKQ